MKHIYCSQGISSIHLLQPYHNWWSYLSINCDFII